MASLWPRVRPRVQSLRSPEDRFPEFHPIAIVFYGENIVSPEQSQVSLAETGDGGERCVLVLVFLTGGRRTPSE